MPEVEVYVLRYNTGEISSAIVISQFGQSYCAFSRDGVHACWVKSSLGVNSAWEKPTAAERALIIGYNDSKGRWYGRPHDADEYGL